MRTLFVLLLSVFFLGACSSTDENRNNTLPNPNQPTNPNPNENPNPNTNPDPNRNVGSGNWSLKQTGEAGALCGHSLSSDYSVNTAVFFCGCYTERITQLMSYNDFFNNSSRLEQVHSQMQNDSTFSTCLNSGTQTSTATEVLTLLY